MVAEPSHNLQADALVNCRLTEKAIVQWTIVRAVAQSRKATGKKVSTVAVFGNQAAPVWLVRDYVLAGAGRRGLI